MRTFLMILFGFMGIVFVCLAEIKQKEEERKELLKVRYIENILFFICAAEVILFMFVLAME